jgi:hypothetical protein
MQKFSFVLFLTIGLVSFSAQADIGFAKQIADNYTRLAKIQSPNATIGADAGRAFYIKKVVVKGKNLSCSACHTDNPAKQGKHNESGRILQPLAPAANPNRFSDRSKSERAFMMHCKDLYDKDCSPQDKANFMHYLVSVKAN